MTTLGPYEIKFGDVWFREAPETSMSTGLRHVCDGSGELAVAFQQGVMLQMGSAKAVRAWFDKKAAMYMLDDESEPVEIVTFPVCEETVAKMNRMHANSSRVIKLFETLTAIGGTRPDLLNRPPSL